MVTAMLPVAPVHADVVTDFLALDYPNIGIDLPIFQDTINPDGTLPVPYQPYAAWHHPYTAWPGQGSRTLLFSHDQPGYFANLVFARVGDTIYVRRSDGFVMTYTVASNQLIQSTDTSWLQPSSTDQLVLLTCTSWSSTDPRRIVVANLTNPLTPTQPLNAYALAGANSAAAYWDPPNFYGLDAPYYTVTAQPGGESVNVASIYHSAGLAGLTPGVAYTLTVRATNSRGSSATVTAGTVTPFPALHLSASPASLVAGSPTTLSVRAEDSTGALVTSYSGSVVIASDDPQAVLPGAAGVVPISGGAGSYPVTLKTAGTRTLRATDAVNPAMTGSASVTVTPGQVAGFRVVAPGLVPEGLPSSATVSSVDAYGNVQPAYGGTVHLAATPPGAATLGADHTYTPADGGVATFSLLPSPGATGANLALTATDTGNAGLTGSGSVTVGYTYYFAWFDRISSPGFQGDNIHVINPNPGSARVEVSIPAGFTGPCPVQAATIPGTSSISATVRNEMTFTCANGFGGPVSVVASLPIQASQRVQYYGSFNEVTAQAFSSADTALYFTWFDRISDPGFLADNIHVLNPSPTTAQVTVHIPTIAGFSCPDQQLTIPPGEGRMATCGEGFEGPVTVVSTNGTRVLASQRVQYYQSFNEEPALSAGSAATSLDFTWFDRISSPGFQGDNIHVVNPSATTALVTVHIPTIGGFSCPDQQLTIPPREGRMASCAQGFGGPVTVVSTNGTRVLASQRVKYYQSFNEVAAMNPGSAMSGLSFSWFDRISSPGFRSDNVHVLNLDPVNPVSVTVHIVAGFTGPCPDQTLTVGAGQEAIVTCANGFGGPVTVTVNTPGMKVLASQRVQYFQSFNEVDASPPGT